MNNLLASFSLEFPILLPKGIQVDWTPDASSLATDHLRGLGHAWHGSCGDYLCEMGEMVYHNGSRVDGKERCSASTAVNTVPHLVEEWVVRTLRGSSRGVWWKEFNRNMLDLCAKTTTRMVGENHVHCNKYKLLALDSDTHNSTRQRRSSSMRGKTKFNKYYELLCVSSEQQQRRRWEKF